MRFAESQVVTDPAGCCRVIADVVSQITGEMFTELAETLLVRATSRWTREQANLGCDNYWNRKWTQALIKEVLSPFYPLKHLPPMNEHEQRRVG